MKRLLNAMIHPGSVWATIVLGAGLSHSEDNVHTQYDGISTNLAGAAVIGATGTNNSLAISGGAQVAARSAIVGEAATAHRNHVLLTDPGSLWQLEAGLTVGRQGSLNSLVVSNAATLTSGAAAIGASAHSNALVVTGVGSRWTARGGVDVGREATGCQLIITDGGNVDVGWCKVGGATASRLNAVIVTGAGSRLRCVSDIDLGSGGSSNSLLVADGGSFSCRRALVAVPSDGRSASVLVTGSGSSWDIVEDLALGYYDTSLAVMDGARLNCGSASLGGFGFRVLISGPEATWRLTSSLSIWGSGFTNTVTVANGGSVVVTNREGTGLLRMTHRGAELRLGGGTVMADRVLLTDGLIEGHGLLVGAVTNLGRFGRSSLSVLPGAGGLRIEGSLHHLGTIQILSAAELAEGLRVQGDFLHRGRMTFELTEDRRLPPEALLAVAGSLTLPGDDSFLVVTLPPGFRPGWTNVLSLIQWGGRTGRFTNAYHGARLPAGSGSFRVLYTETELRLSDYFEDTDEDGIDDLWATTYFGHSPLSPEEKTADADGDGVSNPDEFRAGTDPNDSESRLRILSIVREPAGVRLRFTANGVKWHRVWRSTDFSRWVEVLEPKFTQPAPGVFEWLDEAGTTGVAQAYRVSAQ